uniref:Peptidase aspartic putative domain-containing protein n=1 Tax=Trichuris muris TaxID=70415 RepID=A0A5S6QD40_TRIMR
MESGDDLEQEIEDAMALEALIRATQVEIKRYLSRLPIEEQEQSALAGNALEAISGYSVTAANYPIVIEVLKNRFGKPTVTIEGHILALVQMERRESASAQQLRKLHDSFVQHVRALAALRKDPLKGQLSTADILMAICKQKLPTPVRKRWEGKLTENGQQEDDLNALLRYTESCLEIEECLIEGNARQRRREKKNSYSRNGQLTTASALHASVADHQKCVFCHGNHKIVECNDFTAMNVKSRWRFAKSSQLCFICLQAGHSAANCKERETGNKECHELLRGKTPSCRERSTRISANEDAFQVGMAKASCNSLIGSQIVLAKAHGPNGLSCKVMCLLDAGSQRAFIRKDLADRLGLGGRQENVVITTTGDRQTQRKVKRAEIWLSPSDANACDNFDLFVLRDCACSKYVRNEEKLKEGNEKFWELESIGVKYTEPQEDKSQVFLERLKDTVSYNGERYVVRFPWKMKNPNLPNNYEYAVSRLRQTENRLKNEKLKQTYSEAIEMCVANGWAEEISDNVEQRGKTWHLPHHAVYCEEKVSTRRRIVFDASACYEDQSSNSMLEAGPALEGDSF